MLAQGGTPKGWHTKWVQLCKLQQTDSGAGLHEAMCNLLEIMCCYDQLNAASLASGEVAARQVQMVEDKWKDRII
eukprot:6426303-Karenia_brevis.AAC.1